jgi:hypothetical protein
MTGVQRYYRCQIWFWFRDRYSEGMQQTRGIPAKWSKPLLPSERLQNTVVRAKQSSSIGIAAWAAVISATKWSGTEIKNPRYLSELRLNAVVLCDYAKPLGASFTEITRKVFPGMKTDKCGSRWLLLSFLSFNRSFVFQTDGTIPTTVYVNSMSWCWNQSRQFPKLEIMMTHWVVTT